MAIDGGSPSAVEVHVSEAEAAAEERADRTACDLQARSKPALANKRLLPAITYLYM